jgi:hypothetical protein
MKHFILKKYTCQKNRVSNKYLTSILQKRNKKKNLILSLQFCKNYQKQCAFVASVTLELSQIIFFAATLFYPSALEPL